MSSPSDPRARLLSRDVAFILIAQTTFGFAWSLYLLAPKFQAVVLGAGPEIIGTISAAAAVMGLLTVPFAATGIDRAGRKLYFRIGASLVLLVSIGYLFVDRVGPLLYLLQGLVAAAFVFAFNASAALTADWVSPARIGQAIGWLGAANVCMNAIATAVAEPVADRYGWDAVFVLGIASATLALVVSFALREAPARLAIDSPLVGTPNEPTRADIVVQALARPLAVATLVGAVFSAVFIFIQPFALARGATELRMFFAGFTASAVACRVLIGGLGDRYGHRQVSLVATALYALSALACSDLDPRYLWAYGMACGAAHGVLYPTLNALVLAVVPSSRRGFGMALYNGAFNTGMALGGFGWGLLAAAYGYPALYFVAAGLGLLATVPLWAPFNPSSTRPVIPAR